MKICLCWGFDDEVERVKAQEEIEVSKAQDGREIETKHPHNVYKREHMIVHTSLLKSTIATAIQMFSRVSPHRSGPQQ